MDDTTALRDKLLKLWAAFEKGDLSATEARVHIGFARAVIESLKAEIAAAHLGGGTISAISVSRRTPLALTRQQRRH
jgi:hypothetical protein